MLKFSLRTPPTLVGGVVLPLLKTVAAQSWHGRTKGTKMPISLRLLSLPSSCRCALILDYHSRTCHPKRTERMLRLEFCLLPTACLLIKKHGKIYKLVGGLIRSILCPWILTCTMVLTACYYVISPLGRRQTLLGLICSHSPL